MFLDPPHILKPAPAEAFLPSVQKRQRPGPSSCADDGVEPEGVPLETRGAVIETLNRTAPCFACCGGFTRSFSTEIQYGYGSKLGTPIIGWLILN